MFLINKGYLKQQSGFSLVGLIQFSNSPQTLRKVNIVCFYGFLKLEKRIFFWFICQGKNNSSSFVKKKNYLGFDLFSFPSKHEILIFISGFHEWN